MSTENYEVENLISSDSLSKSRGFIASSFVSPPVEIIVQFPCSVKLCCLLINGKLGNQHSIGCEVFVQSERPRSSKLLLFS